MRIAIRWFRPPRNLKIYSLVGLIAIIALMIFLSIPKTTIPLIKNIFDVPSLNLIFSNKRELVKDENSHRQDEYRKNYIKGMMKHAWRGYAQYAWGFNEVKPITKRPHKVGVFGDKMLGASIIDGIDTLFIMGLNEEYLAARKWIDDNLDFNKYDVEFSVFETTIRYLGGLLSTYALTRDQMFLNQAIKIADKLLPAFDTPSGVPQPIFNMRTGKRYYHSGSPKAAILSELGGMHLEFVYLSHVTGNPRYREKVLKIRETIKKATPRPDGLYNSYMDTETGQWMARPVHISVGALGDSFYEYLLKAYVQSNGRDIEAYRMYIKAIEAFECKLLLQSAQTGLLYFAELKDISFRLGEEFINRKMDTLACFSGGMLALGAIRSQNSSIKAHHMTLANSIADTCHESCARSESGLGPETFAFHGSQKDAIGKSAKYYILRPEIIETYFYMWRFTHDPKYRAWAWDFVKALERHCKVEGGYTGLKNVNRPENKDDVQQSFLLAEVFKYLYLIYSDDSIIDLDHWLFNTEAHPFPILKQQNFFDLGSSMWYICDGSVDL